MKGLDKWLTTEPTNEHQNYYDAVIENLTEDFYAANEDWIEIYFGQYDAWVQKLINKGTDPIQSAKIIERAKTFYKL